MLESAWGLVRLQSSKPLTSKLQTSRRQTSRRQTSSFRTSKFQTSRFPFATSSEKARIEIAALPGTRNLCHIGALMCSMGALTGQWWVVLWSTCSIGRASVDLPRMHVCCTTTAATSHYLNVICPACEATQRIGKRLSLSIEKQEAGERKTRPRRTSMTAGGNPQFSTGGGLRCRIVVSGTRSAKVRGVCSGCRSHGSRNDDTRKEKRPGTRHSQFCARFQ
eukprot:2272129-Amphidinium_carterae.1